MTLSAARPAAKTDGETPRASDMATQLAATQHLKKTKKGSVSHDTELGKINEKSKRISQLNRYIVVRSLFKLPPPICLPMSAAAIFQLS